MRRVPSSAPEPSDSLLFPTVQVDVPWPLLLGLGPLLRDAPGPVHLPALRGPPPSPRARRRPYRGDRAGRSGPRILEPADRLPGVPRSEDPGVPASVPRRSSDRAVRAHRVDPDGPFE